MSAGGAAANPNTPSGGPTSGPFMGGTPTGGAPLTRASGPMGGALMGGAPQSVSTGGGGFRIGPNSVWTGEGPSPIQQPGMPQVGGSIEFPQGRPSGMIPFNAQQPGGSTLPPHIQALLGQYPQGGQGGQDGQDGQGGRGGKGGMPAKRGFKAQGPRMMGGMLGGGGQNPQTALSQQGRMQDMLQRAQQMPQGQPQQPAQGGLEALLGNMAGKKSSTNSLQ